MCRQGIMAGSTAAPRGATFRSGSDWSSETRIENEEGQAEMAMLFCLSLYAYLNLEEAQVMERTLAEEATPDEIAAIEVAIDVCFAGIR